MEELNNEFGQHNIVKMSFSAIILVLFSFLVLVSTPAEAAIKKYRFDVSDSGSSTSSRHTLGDFVVYVINRVRIRLL